jgi:hypothetical protein
MGVSKLIVAAAVTLSATVAVQAAVTVPDYSFESPATSSYTYNPKGVTGVTFNAGSGVQANGSDFGFANTANGTQTAFIQSTVNYTGQISITLSGLVVGQSYQVIFSGAARPTYANNPLTLSFAGSTIGTTTVTTANWTDYKSSVFKPLTTSGTLVLLGTGTTGTGDLDVGIDNVRVVGAVPEPATWAMMIGGFGLIGAAMRRDRRSAFAFI